MSGPCKMKYDYVYDSCIYEVKHRLLEDTFNCTFKLFVNAANMSSSQQIKECQIINITSGGFHTFRDILQDLGQGTNDYCTKF